MEWGEWGLWWFLSSLQAHVFEHLVPNWQCCGRSYGTQRKLSLPSWQRGHCGRTFKGIVQLSSHDEWMETVATRLHRQSFPFCLPFCVMMAPETVSPGDLQWLLSQHFVTALRKIQYNPPGVAQAETKALGKWKQKEQKFEVMGCLRLAEDTRRPLLKRIIRAGDGV